MTKPAHECDFDALLRAYLAEDWSRPGVIYNLNPKAMQAAIRLRCDCGKTATVEYDLSNVKVYERNRQGYSVPFGEEG